MRKLIVIMVILPFACIFAGCKSNDIYVERISELKQDIYTANTEDLQISATYGFKESPFYIDNKVLDLIYGYTFKLDIIPDEIKRSLEFSDENKTYKADFTLDDITSEYKAFIEIQKHFEKQFTVNLICGTDVKSVVLTSVVPENCMSYKKALSSLTEQQRSLFDAYTADGKFNAEIYMRIFVKDRTPYWYIAIAADENKLKAMLIDGFSGELLAIKDIF